MCAMQTRIRLLVLVIVCGTSAIALRTKFSPAHRGEQFVDQKKNTQLVAAQEVQPPTEMPNELRENTMTDPQLPVQEQRNEYLTGGNDPDALYKKYLLASYLYSKHKSMVALPLAISYATQLWRFDDASRLLKELPDIKSLQDAIEIPVLMKLLFNTSDLDFAQLKHFKDFVNTLKEQGSIGETEYMFYYFVLTLVKGDMSNAQFYLSSLQTGNYAWVYHQLKELEEVVNQYGTTPSYYLRGVWAMFLYQQGWWWPARSIGQQIRQEDPKYLLAEQLIAYSSMALQDRKSTILSLQQLQKIDPTYVDVYQFFQAIAHYSLREYETSIALFRQIPEQSVYYQDVVRYLFLAYTAIEDEEHIGQFLAVLTSGAVLHDADVYTIFDSLLYSDQKEKGYPFYKKFSVQIEQLEYRCQRELQEKPYICLYGKWGILLARGEYEKAYQILRRIVNRYPRVSLLKLLGDLAREQKLNEEAEEWYRRAFLVKTENAAIALPTMQ